MLAKEARKLVGCEVVWTDGTSFIECEGMLNRVSGRTAFIENSGGYDWKWLPNMIGLKRKPEFIIGNGNNG